MDNSHFTAAVRLIGQVRSRYMGTPMADTLVIAQIEAVLAVADALDSIDDALRNTVGGAR